MDILTLAQIAKLKKGGGVGYVETIFEPFSTEEVTLPADTLNGMHYSNFRLTAGGIYNVTVNGVTYRAVASTMVFGSSEKVYIGNPSLYDESLEDTGEVFFLQYATIAFQRIYVVDPNTKDASVARTIYITVQNDVLRPIEQKFLPTIIPVWDNDPLKMEYFSVKIGGQMSSSGSESWYAKLAAAAERQMPYVVKLVESDTGIVHTGMAHYTTHPRAMLNGYTPSFHYVYEDQYIKCFIYPLDEQHWAALAYSNG